jgi:hypothetical protein
MLEIREHEIYKFLAKRRGAMKVSDVCDAFGQDRETRDNVRERLLLMARYGVIFRDGEFVSSSKILDKRTKHDKISEMRAKLQSRSLKPIAVEAVNR